MHMKKKLTPEEIKSILKEYNFDIQAIYENESLREKMNLLDIDFEKGKEISRKKIKFSGG